MRRSARLRFTLATVLLTAVVIVSASGGSITSGLPRVAYVGVYLIAALSVLAAARAVRISGFGSEGERRRRTYGWMFLVVYALVVPAAIVLKLWLQRSQTEGLGHLANDLVAFAAYPAAIAAILAFTQRRARQSRATLTLDLAIVVVATVAFAGFVYLRRTADGLQIADSTNILYFVLIPVGALAVLLAGTWLVLDLRARRVDTSLALVLGAITTSTAADLSGWIPGFSAAGLNAGLWATSMWILTAAATVEIVTPVKIHAGDDMTRGKLGYSFVPALSGALVAIALLVDARAHADDASRFLMHGLVIVMLLVITRLFSVLHENRVLLDRQRAQDARFRSLVRRSSDALLVVRPDTRLIYHSPALSTVFGLAEPSAVGLSVPELVNAEDRDAVLALLDSAQRGSTKPAAVVVRSASTPPHWVELVANDHADDPDIGGFVIAARDVTRRRLLESRLAQAEKLEAVGRLAGGIAHDFNNMLTAILGYADLVEQSALRGRVNVEDVQEIQRAARRSAELTRQLLAFARRQMVAPREIEPADVIMSMDRMLRRLLGGVVSLDLELGGNSWRIVADPSQIEQIVLNLALNARDAMPDGGRLLVELSQEEVRSAALPVGIAGDLESMVTGEYVRLRVRDTGSGIPVEHLDRLFEPFFTTKGEGRGTGLGLATVYGITKQASGFLGVDSLPGNGTTFDIYFPRADSGTMQAEELHAPMDAASPA